MIAVGLIWGNILVHYFGLFSTSEEEEYIPNFEIKPQKLVEKRKEYEPTLDYADPFLSDLRPQKNTNLGSVKSKQKATSKVTKPAEIIEPKVVYKGLVKNNKSSKKTGLLVVEGKSYLVTSNKTIGEIQVIRFNEKLCSYKYNGKMKEVAK